MKKRQYECPKCGKFEEVVGSLQEGMDGAETEDGDFYEFVTLNCQCYKCGHRWEEYARLTYDGFYDKEKRIVYNSEGQAQFLDV